MPRGASPKREREYKKLKNEFEKEGRYKGREEEVASRIVNKQRARFGETKGQKTKERQGKSPGRALPIEGYEDLTVKQVVAKASDLSGKEIKQIQNYEKRHKNRKTLLEQLDRSA